MKRLHAVISILVLSLSFCAASPPAEVLLYSTHVEATKQHITYRHVCKIRINSKQGEEYTTVELPFTGKNKPSNIRACITNRDGTIQKTLKKKEIEIKSNLSEFAFYENDYVAEFTLSHNQYPYIMEYSYTEKVDDYIHVISWSPVVSLNIPTNKASLEIICSDDFSINYISNLVEELPAEVLENGKRYTWNASYLEQVTKETKSPPIQNALPFVSVAPEEFSYVTSGKLNSWDSFGEWQKEILEGLQELPDREKSIVDDLLKDVSSEREKMRILYHYLQDETRYIYVGIDEGGLVPHPASYVCVNKYGDCKALSNYYIALLKHAGIKGYYTKVNSDLKVKKIYEDFPSQQFNHIVVCVPIEKDTIWVDCTSNEAFGYFGTYTQNRRALIVSEKSTLHNTPVLTPKDVLNRRTIDVYIKGENVDVNFRNEFRGYNYELINQLINGYSESEIERIIREYIVEDGFELSDFELELLHRDSTVIKMRYEASNNSLYKQYGNDILLKVIPFNIPQFEKVADRTMPVQFDFPVNKLDTLRYHNSDIEFKLPENIDFQSKYGSFSAAYKKENNTLIVIRSIYLSSGYYSLSEYPEFFEFYKKIEKYNQKYIVVTN